MLMHMSRWEELERAKRTLVDYLAAMALAEGKADWREFVAPRVSDVEEAESIYLIPSHMELSLFEREISERGTAATSWRCRARHAGGRQALLRRDLRRLPARHLDADRDLAARVRLLHAADQGRLPLRARSGDHPALSRSGAGRPFRREPRRPHQPEGRPHRVRGGMAPVAARRPEEPVLSPTPFPGGPTSSARPTSIRACAPIYRSIRETRAKPCEGSRPNCSSASPLARPLPTRLLPRSLFRPPIQPERGASARRRHHPRCQRVRRPSRPWRSSRRSRPSHARPRADQARPRQHAIAGLTPRDWPSDSNASAAADRGSLAHRRFGSIRRQDLARVHDVRDRARA